MQKSSRMSGLGHRLYLALGLRHPNEGKVIINMAEVMDQLPKTESPAAAAPAAPAPQRSPVKFIALGMLILAVAAGVWAWFHFRDRVSSDDAQVDAHITAIAPKIPGNVIEVLVKDNQPVKAGDVLVRIDPRDYQARVDIARAALVQAQSQLHTAQTVVPLTNEHHPIRHLGRHRPARRCHGGTRTRPPGLRTGRQFSDIAVAQANVRTRQANNERAQADLARMKPLVDKAEISSLQYDAYQAAARVAESELRAAQEQVSSAQQNAAMRSPPLPPRNRRSTWPRRRSKRRWPIASRWTCAAPRAAPPPPAWKLPAPTLPPPSCSSATPRS